jgi:hypothetical protein
LRRRPGSRAVVTAAGSSAGSTTTKSATSQVKGGFSRRSAARRSTSAEAADSRRFSVRRSQETTTGRFVVSRARASNRRSAPRRTTMPIGFCFDIQTVYRSFLSRHKLDHKFTGKVSSYGDPAHPSPGGLLVTRQSVGRTVKGGGLSRFAWVACGRADAAHGWPARSCSRKPAAWARCTRGRRRTGRPAARHL